MSIRPFRDIKRRKTKVISVGNVKIGGDNPISVQSMTNTLTTDVKSTIKQINDIAEEGADIDGYIKRTNNGKSNTEEDIAIEEIVDREDQSYVEEAYGVDLQQLSMFSFLRKEFTKKDLVPEVGDIIEWDKAYFEIDSLVDNQIVGGKDPDYSLAGELHGSSHSIICNCHMTRMSRIQIEDPRYGNSETTKYDYPKNI